MQSKTLYAILPNSKNTREDKMKHQEELLLTDQGMILFTIVSIVCKDYQQLTKKRDIQMASFFPHVQPIKVCISKNVLINILSTLPALRIERAITH